MHVGLMDDHARKRRNLHRFPNPTHAVEVNDGQWDDGKFKVAIPQAGIGVMGSAFW